MPQSLEEILSRLQILGGSAVGGSNAYASFLPILNASGVLDPSFFAASILPKVWDVGVNGRTTNSTLLASVKLGDIAIEGGQIAYVLAATPATSSANWRTIGNAAAYDSSGIGFDPTGTVLTSFTTVQTALARLAKMAVIGDISTPGVKSVSEAITFNVPSAAPFLVGAGSTGQLVTGLNADLLDGQHGAYYRDAGNLNAGTVPSGRLSGTYNISIQGVAATATTAVTALSANNATHATTADSATEADHATSADSATTATNATNLYDGTANRAGSYYLDISHMTAGLLAGARFNDTSHGNRAGGTLHAAATQSVSGFLSATDKTKLDGIAPGAQVNVPAFYKVTVGGTDIVASNALGDTLTIASSASQITLTPDAGTKTLTLGFALGSVLHSSLGHLTAPYDDHTQYVHNDTARTITAKHTFNPSVVGAPFILGANALNQLITGLNAELLNGQNWLYFRNASNLNAGTVPRARLAGTYDISITGTASGALSTGGGVVTGDVTVAGLTISTLTDTTDRIAVIDTTGRITVGATTDLLPEGSTNRYATPDFIWDYLSSGGPVGAPVFQATDTIHFDITSQDVVKANFIGTSDNVTEGSTNKYATPANILAGLAIDTTKLTKSGSQLGVITTTTGEASKIVMLDASSVLRAGDAILHDITAHNVTANQITITGSVVNPTDAATKGYVDGVTLNAPAIYDYPVTSLSNPTTRTTYVGARVGEIVHDGSNYYVLVAYPSSNTNNWLQLGFTPTASTGVQGLISSKNTGELLKLATLVQSQAAGMVFCPALRVTEPLRVDKAGNNNGADNFTNTNWKKYSRRSLQVRGRVGKGYFLLLRARGWVKLQHKWTISYYQPGQSSPTTFTVNSFTSSQPTISPSYVKTSEYQYVDAVYPIYVAGASNMVIEMMAYDGKFTDPTSGIVFPGIPPYTDNGAKDAFNGGFLQIEGQGVWSMNPNEPFNPFAPDLFNLQSEGEIISGGASYYPADPSIDNRVYDGESLTDSQDVTTKFNVTNTGGYPTYTINSNGSAAFEKARLRCNYTVFNKLSGFNGFLRVDNSVTSGKGLTAPLVTSLDQLATIPINSHKLAADIAAGTYSIVTGFNAVVSTNLQEVLDSLNASGQGTATFDVTNDRFTIQCASASPPTQPPVYFSSGLFNTIRMSFGAITPDAGQSLPVTSGLRITDSVSTANFAVPVSVINTDTGTFAVDDYSVSYTKDTIIGPYVAPGSRGGGYHLTIMDMLGDLGYILTYNVDANEFVLTKKPGTTSDLASLTPPRAYDIIGNLMVAMGLEKESHGNADFPVEAVHAVHYQPDGIVVGGNFRNYCGVTSPGLAKVSFDGKPDSFFDVGIGFDGPIFNIADVRGDNSHDLMVSSLDLSSYKGYNKKPLYRIAQTGAENTTTNILASNISGDNQSRVLGIIPTATGDFIVLTPRKLMVYNSAGVIISNRTYVGSKSFHGMTKYKETSNPARTYFLLASTAYVGPTATQKFNNVGEPLGLRLMYYDHLDSSIHIDATWAQTPTFNSLTSTFGPGAGTGAEASCAYPVVGGFGGDGLETYVVCGNRGTYWNSGVTAEPGNTAWNERGKGNLLKYSEQFKAPLGQEGSWPWQATGDGLQPIVEGFDGYGRRYSVLSSNPANADEVGYLTQDFNATNYPSMAKLCSYL
jgi:hypothetical protein